MNGSHGIFLNRNGSELDLMMKEFLIKKIREKGPKLTPQRLAVIDVLEEDITVLSARGIPPACLNDKVCDMIYLPFHEEKERR